jgi:urease accessory protein
MPAALVASSFLRAGFHAGAPLDSVELEAPDRHLRRKLLRCLKGTEVLVEFESPVALRHGDALVLDSGQLIEIVAAEEELMEVRGRDSLHLAQLAWHIGNRHLEAQIESHRILLKRDHVIAHMLEQLGAHVVNVRERFSPEAGAYHHHSGSHEH